MKSFLHYNKCTEIIFQLPELKSGKMTTNVNEEDRIAEYCKRILTF